ncbi:MAG: Hpt domain-containing protein [Gammaproteobacteria bacterium]|nr:Hpt domain-containing protein [Gammaproteobacteria bacterium]
MSNRIITSELLKEEPDLISLIDRFISRLPGMQEAIVKAFNDKDWETFTDLIHQMKGVGGNYGYPMLTTLCTEIEAMAKEENFAKVENQLNEFNLISENILAGSDENHKIAEQS